MTGGRARTVFIGSGGFGRDSLRLLDGRPDVELVAVVTAPSRPAGRGGHVRSTTIHGVADQLAVPVILTPERLGARDAVTGVLALEPDLIVLADYGQIVPAALLAVRYGALNLHPSLLPRHRGATPVPAAILAGDRETGATLMHMDDGLDTGPLVGQTRVVLDGTETTPKLEATLATVAADLLAEHLGPWVRGELVATPQPIEGATMTRSLRRADGRLDPSRSAVDLERQVRAYQPWPGSFVETVVGRLVVWAAEATGAGSERVIPGRGTFDLEGVGVGAGERLRLRVVQPAGGTRMTWDAFVRGRPSIVGSSVGAGP